MGGDYLLSVDGVKIGRVARFEGNPKNQKWVGMARPRKRSDPDNHQCFRTKREAKSWVENEAYKLGYKYDD